MSSWNVCRCVDEVCVCMGLREIVLEYPVKREKALEDRYDDICKYWQRQENTKIFLKGGYDM